ncbi:ciliary-associated calcium-binding coiled-coil protein 1 isoform X2 [Mobula birostris]|uniref:ciliary-associated calcium-binding coiled-coil protein 1 isoform X2 n=1 Tax=Mobula birostris TaxID=1983395 RepID=UPI003B28B545
MAASRTKIRTAKSHHKVNGKAIADSTRIEEVTVREKENPLAWKFISFPEMSELARLKVDLVEKALAEILQLEQYQYCMKEGSLLDYYVSGFWWAKEQDFTLLQMSVFMTILNIILENISNKHLPLLDNLRELTKLMTEVSQSSSDKSRGVEFFTVDQAKAIIDYMKISVFQHYGLYEFLFHHTPDLGILDTKDLLPCHWYQYIPWTLAVHHPTSGYHGRNQKHPGPWHLGGKQPSIFLSCVHRITCLTP